MDSRRRKQNHLRRQVVPNALDRTKSSVRIEFMPPLLENPDDEECVTHDHLVFKCESPLHQLVSKGGGGGGVLKDSVKRERNQSVLIQQYGNSGRWRLITAVPELNHQVSSRRKKDLNVEGSLRGGKKEDGGEEVSGGGTSSSSGFGCGFFRAAVSACKACHAMEPASMSREDALLREHIES